jgi:hypothetical protein|tara:strand:+ start:37 stop:201 length:165 start_codon:yes stop_codon:yes gene_type:complete
MARDVFGNKKITTEDLYTKKRISNGDIQSEYVKIIFMIVCGYIFFHFIIMGWTI